MYDYDAALKALLQSPESLAIETVTGVRVARWLNTELSEVKQMRLDMLGVTPTPGEYVHIELQSHNDSQMALRMAEYALAAYRKYRAFPRQYVLYVGEEKLRMRGRLEGADFQFRYALVDVRDLDEEALLDSPFDSDSVLAILTRHRDRRETIRRILAKIATLEKERRAAAVKALMILAGLRKLSETVEKEMETMPILSSILDHDLLGPTYQKGRQEGLQEGRQEGDQAILRGLLERKFGPLPGWAEKRLMELSTNELEELAIKVLDAKSLDEVIRQA